ncbi:gem-associated protein 6 [Protopterus annectens]|uniref:gem-associated protein 6 n=1 Tax=Protopterus annectens TaxID=7888 RepID=UPI001CFBBC4E|nr:gem-associated protein 6 [Protopterus annectens]XP_043920959.1 gem-associated protein 6 [Protopterus annectens]XP_043920960.1 gem-associated protein 6 [Protopterus annectens]
MDVSEWSKKKPAEWQEFLNKEVSVTDNEKSCHQGWVFTIDPVSGTIVLVQFLEDRQPSVVAVMGHAVQKVEVLREGDNSMSEKLTALLMPERQAYSQKQLEQKKQTLKDWLLKNRIPVTEQGRNKEVLCVAGVLTVAPPYRSEDCSSSNQIILSRIQSLIQSQNC